MVGKVRQTTEIDRDLRRAADRFAEEIGRLSSDLILREGVLRAAVCALVRAVEEEFDGYQDIFGKELQTHGALLSASYEPSAIDDLGDVIRPARRMG